MEAMSEQQQAAATPTAGNPLSPPLPQSGERSLTERSVTEAAAGERANVAARPEESLLGAKPAQEPAAAETTEAPEQAKPQQEVAEPPARPTYGEFKLPEGVAVDAE